MSRKPPRPPAARPLGHGAPLRRRTFLRGILAGAAVSVGLPPLECMLNPHGTAYAFDGAFPKRFGLFFWGNGNLPTRWTPDGQGAGSDWSLSEQLAPLAAMKPKISVLSGLSVKLPNQVPHGSGAAGILSGAPLSQPNDDGTFTQPSVDQVIASAVGGETLFRSLETSVHPSTQGRSYNGPNSRNPPEPSPHAFYQRIFGVNFQEPGEGVVNPTIGLRRSVLDAVTEQLAHVRGRVGAADQARLDQHTDGIRDLEQRLAKLQEDPPELEACARPAAPEGDYPDILGRPQLALVNHVMCDLLAMALACDQTRVFSHWFSDPVNNLLFADASAGHHDLTHNEPGAQPQCHAITVKCIEAFAQLLQSFDAIPEGDGTLLDHCAVLGLSEISLGQTHSLEDMPLVVGGSCGGALRTGLHHRSVGDNASKLILTLIRALDVPQPSFGVDGAHTTDGLSVLEA